MQNTSFSSGLRVIASSGIQSWTSKNFVVPITQQWRPLQGWNLCNTVAMTHHSPEWKNRLTSVICYRVTTALTPPCRWGSDLSFQSRGCVYNLWSYIHVQYVSVFSSVCVSTKIHHCFAFATVQVLLISFMLYIHVGSKSWSLEEKISERQTNSSYWGWHF